MSVFILVLLLVVKKEAKMSLTSSLLELGGMAQGVIWRGEKCRTNISSSVRLEWLE